MQDDRVPSRRVADTGNDVRALVEPGSWWRVNAPGDASPEVSEDAEEARKVAERLHEKPFCEGFTTPDHGLILLVNDVAVIDGEVHSVTLHPHPAWEQRAQTRALINQFLLFASHAPDGADLRAAEEASLMRHVEGLTENMSRPPEENDVEALVEEKLSEGRNDDGALRPAGDLENGLSEADRALVPTALLPGRDVKAAEEALRYRVAEAEARSDLVARAVDRVTRGTQAVARFQEEKVATAQAGISRQRETAEALLSNVHSMRLWLGQGVEVKHLLEGRPAADDAPVHFMQQLLYLDEEIFVESMMGEGFTNERLEDLPELLRDAPGLIDRLMPHEKCVTITRVRRGSRKFEMPRDMQGVFEIFEKEKQDKLVQIFVRDGENVSMIIADDETSGATQLFPSRAEIDKIYTPSFARDGERIDMSDVRYPEKRAAHEKRALFYKRFLLILWGAHEREGVLGGLPQGMNWLTRETQNAWFRFVHDLEAGLPDDMVSVKDWVASHNAMLRPGSRAVITWDRLLTEEHAPGAWSNHVHHVTERVKDPVEPVCVVDLKRSGTRLSGRCEMRPRCDVHDRRSGVTVSVLPRLGDVKSAPYPGVICIDHMTSKEARRYVESRAQRRSYLEWLGEIKLALPVIRSRERAEAALVNRLVAKGGDDVPSQDLAAVAHAAVLACGWGPPPSSKDAGLLKQARAMRAARGLATPEDLQVRVRPGGSVMRFRERGDGLPADLPRPFLSREKVTATRKGVRAGEARPVLAARAPDPGEVVVHESAASVDLPERWKGARAGMTSLADIDLLKDLENAEGALEDVVGRLCPMSDRTAERWLSAVLEHNRATRYVEIPMRRAIYGAAILPARLLDSHLKGLTIQLLGVSVDPVYAAWLFGQGEAAENLIKKLYRYPERAFDRLETRRRNGSSPVSVWMTDETATDGLVKRRDAALSGDADLVRLQDAMVSGVCRDEGVCDVPPATSLGGMVLARLMERRLKQTFRPPEREEMVRMAEEGQRIEVICPDACVPLVTRALSWRHA